VQYDGISAESDPFFHGPTDDESMLDRIQEMVESGFGDRVLVSTDASVFVNPPEFQYDRDNAYLYGTFQAKLRERIGDDATDAVLRDNVVRAFRIGDLLDRRPRLALSDGESADREGGPADQPAVARRRLGTEAGPRIRPKVQVCPGGANASTPTQRSGAGCPGTRSSRGRRARGSSRAIRPSLRRPVARSISTPGSSRSAGTGSPATPPRWPASCSANP